MQRCRIAVYSCSDGSKRKMSVQDLITATFDAFAYRRLSALHPRTDQRPLTSARRTCGQRCNGGDPLRQRIDARSPGEPSIDMSKRMLLRVAKSFQSADVSSVGHGGAQASASAGTVMIGAREPPRPPDRRAGAVLFHQPRAASGRRRRKAAG